MVRPDQAPPVHSVEGSGGGETPSEPLEGVVFQAMRSDRRPPVTDAEFEVIYPPPGARPPSWISRQLSKVPLAFWIVAALALGSVAKGSQP